MGELLLLEVMEKEEEQVGKLLTEHTSWRRRKDSEPELRIQISWLNKIYYRDSGVRQLHSPAGSLGLIS